MRGKYNVYHTTRARFRVAMVIGALAGLALAVPVILHAAMHTNYDTAAAVPSLVGSSLLVAAILILVPLALLKGLWSLVSRRYRERWE